MVFENQIITKLRRGKTSTGLQKQPAALSSCQGLSLGDPSPGSSKCTGHGSSLSAIIAIHVHFVLCQNQALAQPISTTLLTTVKVWATCMLAGRGPLPRVPSVPCSRTTRTQ
jgi:hypothetical protein